MNDVPKCDGDFAVIAIEDLSWYYHVEEKAVFALGGVVKWG